MSVINGKDITCDIVLRWISMDLFDDNFGSGNGLVPSGKKPLPEEMLSSILVAIWHH